MNGLRNHLVMTVRLYFRNRMALLYGYLFPVIFLFAFDVYYMLEKDPLHRHMGELLAVTALSGVCFGLPTTLVSERERGVWRRYKLSPMSTGSLVASTILARYFTTVTAGVMQILIGLMIGMQMPNHPFQLLIAFSFVCFGFVGMGLVVATMADTVPAVQALGQCLFLPLLMIGGVAVPLGSLPTWAQHISAFFPGRFAVEAMDDSIRFGGLHDARFSLVALTVIGAASVYAGTKLFRWDSQQKFAIREGKGLLSLAFASWILVGLATEWKGRALVLPDRSDNRIQSPIGPPPRTAPQEPPSDSSPATKTSPPQAQAPAPAPLNVLPPSPTVASPASASPPASVSNPSSAPVPAPDTAVAATNAKPADNPSSADTEPWRKLEKNSWWGLPYDDLPGDKGVEAPLASIDEDVDQDTAAEVAQISKNLPKWSYYAKEPDPVQRARNVLYVAVIPDAAKWTSERSVPWAVYDRLTADYTKDDLIKILTWIALHPTEGSVEAAEDFQSVGPPLNPPSEQELRLRTMWYATKFVAELLGKSRPQ